MSEEIPINFNMLKRRITNPDAIQEQAKTETERPSPVESVKPELKKTVVAPPKINEIKVSDEPKAQEAQEEEELEIEPEEPEIEPEVEPQAEVKREEPNQKRKSYKLTVPLDEVDPRKSASESKKSWLGYGLVGMSLIGAVAMFKK